MDLHAAAGSIGAKQDDFHYEPEREQSPEDIFNAFSTVVVNDGSGGGFDG